MSSDYFCTGSNASCEFHRDAVSAWEAGWRAYFPRPRGERGTSCVHVSVKKSVCILLYSAPDINIECALIERNTFFSFSNLLWNSSLPTPTLKLIKIILVVTVYWLDHD